MKTSSTGRQLIESFEGLILTAYDDYSDHVVQEGDAVHGTLTIGYGHTNAAGAPKVFIGQTITKQQADDILAADLSKVEADVNRLVKVPLNQNQYDAIVSFQFNTGALGKSSVLRYLNQKDFDNASKSLLLYNKGNGRVLTGLVRRREAEKNLFLKPMSVVHGTAAGTIIAGGAAAIATTPHHYWWYIIPATLVLALITFVTVKSINSQHS